MGKKGKFLNLDEMLPGKYEFQYKDKCYEVLPLTVEDYLRISPDLDKLTESEGKLLNEETFPSAVEVMGASVPSFPKEELKKMPLVVIGPLFEFISSLGRISREEEPKKK